MKSILRIIILFFITCALIAGAGFAYYFWQMYQTKKNEAQEATPATTVKPKAAPTAAANTPNQESTAKSIEKTNAPKQDNGKQTQNKLPPKIAENLANKNKEKAEFINLFPEKESTTEEQAHAEEIKHAPPPLALQLIGEWDEDQQRLIAVSFHNKTLILCGDCPNPKEGWIKNKEVIEQLYRLEKIESHQVIFTYLPLNIEQTLMLN